MRPATKLFAFLAALLLTDLLLTDLVQLPSLRGQEPDASFQTIFNGSNLTGWAGAVEDYEVVDGTIVCKQGRGGVLFTEQTYTNFCVTLEFKLPPGGNNGLAIRYPGEGRASYDGMCEVQVLDTNAEKYKNLDPRQYHGAVYGIAPAKKGFLKPVGQWNRQRVTVIDSTIKVELNGHEITDADVSKIGTFLNDHHHPGLRLTQGHFGFAGHNDPVMYRNIRIKPLPAPASYSIDRKLRSEISGHLIFHSSFDDTTDANLSTGDGRVATASNLKREETTPGNQIPSVQIVQGEGKFRDALSFAKKTDQVLLYSGIECGYRQQDWRGTVSFWMKLDPNKDLEPGFCDPLQITQKAWNDGAFFVDFDKTLPRDFRLGVFSDFTFWNPENTKWDDVSTDKRPLVTVRNPPFSSENWTHICFTWEDVNSAAPEKESSAKLYLNGELCGEINRPIQIAWDPAKVAIMLGINYIGLLDDLAIFDKPLTAEQIRILFEYPMGISYLSSF